MEQKSIYDFRQIAPNKYIMYNQYEKIKYDKKRIMCNHCKIIMKLGQEFYRCLDFTGGAKKGYVCFCKICAPKRIRVFDANVDKKSWGVISK